MSETSPKLLITRPREDARRFADACAAKTGRAIETLIAPLHEIKPLKVDIDIARFPTLVFTSANGVRQTSAIADLTDHNAFCVGDITAQVAAEHGLRARSAKGTVKDLRALIIAARPQDPLLHLHGTHTRGDLAKDLRSAGIETEEAVIYDQTAQPLSDDARALLARPGRVIAPVFSPRSARLLKDAAANARAALTFVAISRAAAEALGKTEADIVIAEHPDAAAMVDAVARLLAPDLPC